ncbi:MAG TPA: hypothetical protein VNQ90_03795 [Chthoniobacteraceae bacterium]|nr:hypothetical protein [Chthoniobacteraceae bacterium]
MAFKRWGCEFDGPWPNTDILRRRSGIWVVWRKCGNRWEVIEVGESWNVQFSLLARSGELEKQIVPPDTLHYSATYTPSLSAEARRELAARIRLLALPSQ